MTDVLYATNGVYIIDDTAQNLCYAVVFWSIHANKPIPTCVEIIQIIAELQTHGLFMHAKLNC